MRSVRLINVRTSVHYSVMATFDVSDLSNALAVVIQQTMSTNTTTLPVQMTAAAVYFVNLVVNSCFVQPCVGPDYVRDICL